VKKFYCSIKYVKINFIISIKNTQISKTIWYIFNIGFLLFVILMVQLFTGFLLTFYYTAHVNHAFNSVIYLMLETNYGWVFRYIHANFASLFFVVIYLHIFRNIFLDSIKFKKVWSRGYVIYFLLIIIAFIGYVLVWGQISLWGATVITNLLSVFVKGEVIVIWIWGSFSVNNPILQCFFFATFYFTVCITFNSLSTFLFITSKRFK